MNDENMIFEEQTEQESNVEEVQTNEEQTEQDSASSLDDILAGVNELLEQSASYNAYLEENQSEPENSIIAYDNGNAVAVSDLDAIAVQAVNSSVYPGTLFDFPIVPAELTTLVNKLFEYIQVDVIRPAIDVFLAVWAVEHAYQLVLWVLRKVPILGIK